MEQFTAENGLPQNTVRSLAMDRSGYLWVTTEGGLVRYDGRHMRAFTTLNDTDLIEDRVGHLFVDGTGALLVNDVLGNLYRISVGDVERVVGGRLSVGYERMISGGVPSIKSYRTLMRAEAEENLSPWSNWDMRILPLPNGEWARHSCDQVHFFTEKGPRMSVEAGAIMHGAFKVKEELFYLGRDRVFHSVDRSLGIVRDLKLHGVDPFAIDRILWSSAGTEVFAVGPTGIWRLITVKEGAITFEAIAVVLPANTKVNAVLLSDNARTLFVGTSTKGLFRYTRHRFRGLVPAERAPEHPDNAFYAQVVLDHDRVLTTHGLVCDSAGFSPKTFPNVPFEMQVLHRDQQGHIWSLRSDTLRVHEASTGSVILRTLSPVGRVSVFLEEGDTLWWAGALGLAAWVGDSAHLVVKHVANNYKENPFALVRGPDGYLWWATGNGVFRIVGRTFVPVPGLEAIYARTLCLWRGRMLVGTYGEGPLVVDQGKVVKLPLDAGGALSHVHAFIPDARGRLWMPTNHGFFRVEMEALEAYLADPERVLAYRSFGRNEGLRTLEFNGGCSPPYVRLANGEVSVPTIDGLVRFVPEAVLDAPELFRPTLDAVLLNDQAHPFSPGVPLAMDGSDRLTLHFTLPYWGNPSDLRICYRVRGLDERWLPLDQGLDRITMERMPPGTYTVQVMRVGDAAGVRDLLRLSVLASWYERPWAMALGVLLAVAGVWALLRLRTDQLLRARNQLEALVNERTQALQRSNTELLRASGVKDRLISILAHDIVSPLRFISRVATRTLRSARSEKPEVLRHTLAEISSSSEKLYANASNILEWIRNQGGAIAVVPTEVAMRELTEEVLAQFQQHASTVRFINAVPEHHLLLVDPKLLAIVLQNLIANAAGHAGGLVSIEGLRTAKSYRITVKDNGPGMTEAARQRIRDLRGGHADDRTATGRPGLGYMIIHDILELIEGDYNIETPAEGGTWVHVEVPVDERA